MRDTYRQLSFLSDHDLLLVKEDLDKIIQERGIYLGSRKIPPASKREESATLDAEKYMSEDWGSLFDFVGDEEQKYYVYFHVDPRVKRFHFFGMKNKGAPFYVGKGVGNRAKCKRRSKPHRALIDEILACGYSIDDVVHIVEHGLPEVDALILESKYINFFGCRSELPKLTKPYFTGRKQGMLINTDTGIRPKWIDNYIESIRYIPARQRAKKIG